MPGRRKMKTCNKTLITHYTHVHVLTYRYIRIVSLFVVDNIITYCNEFEEAEGVHVGSR